ncbi:SLACS retrotransposable element [Trypanosoma cruzi]|uniref:SLACS retrotransposable element n=1 Tax=Trypanosoma cruzi TaxID=5693 RepID=A0A2V2UM60_TRYCR|nr:SLACS retrotransposable element [Trypanosoma cruzi]
MRRHHTNNHLCPRKKWRWRRKVWEAMRGNQKHRDTLQVRKTVDTHFHTTRHQRCWIPCGVWQVGATTVSRDCVVGNTYDRISMRSTVSRNGWTSPMKRSSRKDWFGVTRAGKFARPACEHGQHIDHAVATTHVGRKTLRHSGRSTGRRLPDPTIPRRRRVWNGHPPWNGRRHRPPTRGKTRGCRKECRRDVTSTARVANWLDVCRTVMLGYNASAPDERSRKQVAIMDLVRHHLRLPEKPSSRRHATRTNHNKQHNTDPPIDHFNNTTSESCRAIGRPRTTRRARSAMRRSNRTRRHTRQSEYLPRPTYTRRDAQRHCARCRQGTRSRAPHGGGGGAGGIFPRAGPKP